MRRRLRYSLEYGALRMAEAAVPRLPAAWIRPFGESLGELTWRFDRRGRSVVQENLRVAFGEAMSGEERAALARRNYRVFGRVFAELFWTRSLRPRDAARHFVLACESPEAERAYHEGGCIFATAHFGNFEWLSVARAIDGRGIMIIAQDFKNPPLTAIFRRLRSQHSQRIIGQDGAMIRQFKYLRSGGAVAALVDLNAHPDQSATIIRCFGKLTCISVIHVALAVRTGRPVVPCLAVPREDGRWEMRFFEPFHPDPAAGYAAAAQRCWDVFEPVIREHPAYWMWLYKHWRYLPANSLPGEYPAYANRSGRFDRLNRSLKGGRTG